MPLRQLSGWKHQALRFGPANGRCKQELPAWEIFGTTDQDIAAFAWKGARMKKLSQIVISSVAGCLVFAQSAFAGATGYTTTPIVEDSGSDAGVFLLLAVGALIVIGGLAKPKPPAEPSVDAPDTTE
jgi:hypothetical protein